MSFFRVHEDDPKGRVKMLLSSSIDVSAYQQHVLYTCLSAHSPSFVFFFIIFIRMIALPYSFYFLSLYMQGMYTVSHDFSLFSRDFYTIIGKYYQLFSYYVYIHIYEKLFLQIFKEEDLNRYR